MPSMLLTKTIVINKDVRNIMDVNVNDCHNVGRECARGLNGSQSSVGAE
jgi:hypothetical protein